LWLAKPYVHPPMPKLTLTIFISFFLSAACAQKEMKQHVKETLVPVSTIEPDSVNYADLEQIGIAIGDARVVMLGEQDHGDAPVFLAKTRLIRYLHEKKGFNVLAFESDFFGLNYGWDQLKKEKGKMDSFIRKNIFPIWTYCHTCQELFYNYIPATHSTTTPIAITGFDNQMILQYASKQLVTKLDSVCKALNLPVVKDPEYSTKMLPAIDSLRYFYSPLLKNTDFHINCSKYLAEIKRQASSKLDKDNFWMMVIENLIRENEEYQSEDFWLKRNTRDAQMAQNLQWLARVKYPDEKIIVWAANYHVAKYDDVSTNYPYKELITMGSYFTRDSSLRKQTYIMGFTSYEGEAGRLGMQIYKIRKPKANGFENWIDKRYNYAFVNFKSLEDRSARFYLKALNHSTAFKRDWANVFDGVFYIKNLYPCRR
jgi:erythromycin esterase